MPKIKRTTIELEDELKDDISDLHMRGYADKDQEAARANLRHLLTGDLGDTTKPYCTCACAGGYTFDQQMGIFVHIPNKAKVFCYKPSKAYFNAAVTAGIIRP